MNRKAKIKLVIAASVGNFLEFFDFGIYSFFAIIIGKLFFQSDNPAVSLLLSLSVFGVGFFMRPLGSIIIGAYADRHGRKAAMLLTISLMALGSACIAFAPTYATIGVAAPLIILAGRLLQGFSAGGEVGAATTLLVESAGPHQRGLFVSWQFATQAFASLAGAGFGAFLSWALTPEELNSWGWRIPFIFALLIIPVGLYIRKHVEETFDAEKQLKSGQHPLGVVLRTMPQQFIASIGMIIPGTILTYTVVVYMPTFLQKVTAIPPTIIYLVTVAANAVNAAGNIAGGLIYDKLSYRKYTIIAMHLFSAVFATAMFLSLHLPAVFFITLLMASFVMGIAAPMKTTLVVEAFPAEVRTTAMAVTYSLGVAIFGGTAQMFVTWLIDLSGGNAAAPLWYLLPMIFLGIASYFQFKEKRIQGEVL